MASWIQGFLSKAWKYDTGELPPPKTLEIQSAGINLGDSLLQGLPSCTATTHTGQGLHVSWCHLVAMMNTILGVEEDMNKQILSYSGVRTFTLLWRATGQDIGKWPRPTSYDSAIPLLGIYPEKHSSLCTRGYGRWWSHSIVWNIKRLKMSINIRTAN